MAVTKTPAAQQSCMICEAPNRGGALVCEHCAAPMSLRQDSENGQGLRIVSVLGDSNAGKTMYLGFLLDMLSQRAGDFESVPKAAHVVDLQHSVMNHLAMRSFPPKTPVESSEWSWAYHQVTKRGRRGKRIDLVMPDLAGEAIAAEVTTPSTFRVIQRLLGMSSGVILLVDAAMAANGSMQPDFFGLKIMSYIDGLFRSKFRRRIKMPIAVVLSKSDYCTDCFDDPRRFAQANLNRFWNMCQNRFSNTEFFACSVVGSLGYAVSNDDDYVRPIPLHATPVGVLEPFEWIMKQL